MKHRINQKKLGRNSAARASLLRSLSISFLQHEKIVTTLPKAKALRSYVEKLITKAKRSNSLHARRLLINKLRDATIVDKLFSEFAIRYSDRKGGYSRVLKYGFRKGDCAPMAVIEFVSESGNVVVSTGE